MRSSPWRYVEQIPLLIAAQDASGTTGTHGGDGDGTNKNEKTPPRWSLVRGRNAGDNLLSRDAVSSAAQA